MSKPSRIVPVFELMMASVTNRLFASGRQNTIMAPAHLLRHSGNLICVVHRASSPYAGDDQMSNQSFIHRLKHDLDPSILGFTGGRAVVRNRMGFPISFRLHAFYRNPSREKNLVDRLSP